MKWCKINKCGNTPKIARRVSLQEMRQQQKWAQEAARKATMKKEGAR